MSMHLIGSKPSGSGAAVDLCLLHRQLIPAASAGRLRSIDVCTEGLNRVVHILMAGRVCVLLHEHRLVSAADLRRHRLKTSSAKQRLPSRALSQRRILR